MAPLDVHLAHLEPDAVFQQRSREIAALLTRTLEARRRLALLELRYQIYTRGLDEPR